MDESTDLHRLADALRANGRDLDAEMEWLARLLQRRLSAYFADPSSSPPLPDAATPPPGPGAGDSPFARRMAELGLSDQERALVALALAPHLRPQLLDVLWTQNEATRRVFTEFGGVPGSHGSFLPTAQTGLFLLAGDDLSARFAAARRFDPRGTLHELDLVRPAAVPPDEPFHSGALRVGGRFLGLVMGGREPAPAFDERFPARRITTGLTWDDLVLPASTIEQLEEVRSWMLHGRTLLRDWGMANRIRPGHVCLFCGPPGTGKTLSACLLAKLCGCEAYKIDLSMVVSKYIGETEKNLARVFDQAERRGWILFFDEADALFGRRSQRAESANDRHANQEVSFLLQRIEEFDGVVVLASNLRDNIDEAFLRRFQSIVQFPMPKPTERLRLWREAFPSRATLDPALDLERIAERFEFAGGTIVNVARHAALKALARGDRIILAADVDEGIRRELLKEGRAY